MQYSPPSQWNSLQGSSATKHIESDNDDNETMMTMKHHGNSWMETCGPYEGCGSYEA